MRKLLVITLLIFVSVQYSTAQDKTLFSKEQFIKGGDTLNYRMLLPENFDVNKQYPVLFFLHGSGERGNDNEAQLVHGTKPFLNAENRQKYPAIIIFPQCPQDDFWANVKFGDGKSSERFSFQKGVKPNKSLSMLMALLAKMKSEKFTDNDRFYVGGLSMGAMGTFEILRRKPNLFASAFAICGGDHVENVKKYKHVPLWVFHGAKDNVVPIQKSEIVVNELKRLDANVKFTVYPDANHNSWDAAFAEPDFLGWIFSLRK
jgi:predicted peptidase